MQLFTVPFFVGLLTLSAGAWADQVGLELSGAWVRALPPTQPTTAAYLTVRNAGPAAVVISGARVEGAGRVEIHTTREVDGLMRMAELETLDLPAGGSVALAPGGVHLMLLDLERMPREGEQRRLCLLTAAGSEVCTEAAVRKDAAAENHHHHH